MDIGHLQRGEDIHRSGPARGGRKIVVPNQKKRRDTGFGQPVQAFGEFPLMSLRRVAPFVGVTGQQHQIDPFIQSKLHHLLQRIKEISQPGGKPRLRVGAAVILHTDMEVGKMKDSHLNGSIGFPRASIIIVWVASLRFTSQIMLADQTNKQEAWRRDFGQGL